jgi:hypothetical protein
MGDRKDNEEEDEQEQGEVTSPKDPIDEAEASKKRKGSPMKPSSWKNSKSIKPKLDIMLMVDDIDLIIVVVLDTSEDILQHNEEKQETMYESIEEDLRGVQQALHSSRAVSTATPPSEGIELGDEPASYAE